MTNTQDLPEVGCGALVRLLGCTATAKTRPDSPGWWWRYASEFAGWREAWTPFKVVEDHDRPGLWVEGIEVNSGWLRKGLWVKAALPFFEPSAVRSSEASASLDVADCCIALAEAREYANEMLAWMEERRNAPDFTTLGMIQERLRPLCGKPNDQAVPTARRKHE